MWIILKLQDHVNWSDKRIIRSQKKVVEYCKEHKLNYIVDPSLDCYEGPPCLYEPLDMFEILVDMLEKSDFLEFCSFVTEKLGAPPDVIHIPYQILCVNGNGNFEVKIGLPKVDEFVQDIWGKRIQFPKIEGADKPLF